MNRLDSRRPPARTSALRHTLSFGALAVAVLLRWLLDPLMGDVLPHVTLFGAVAAAVWLSGYRAASVVAIIGYLACTYLFIAPRGTLAIAELGQIVGAAVYLVTCALIIGLGEALRVSKARAAERGDVLRVTLRSIGDGVITTDVEGRVTYLNAVAESLTGWTQQDAFGKPLDAVFHIVNETTREPVENPALRALEHGSVVGLANHTVLIRKDGSEASIEDSAAPIRDERERVSGCVLTFRDVTEHRRLERARANQHLAARLLASIVESSDVAIISKSLDGVIQSWNTAAEHLFGYSPEQAVGRHISLVIPPERMAEEEAIMTSLMAGERVEHLETERLHADGRRIWVSLIISPVKDEDGNVIAASKMVRDITRERHALADRERFAMLIESSPDFVAISDLQGTPTYVNRGGLELVGLENLEQARKIAVWDFFFPEDQRRIRDDFFPSVLEKGRGEVEIRFRHFKTGEPRWMAYKVLALTDNAGRPMAFATVSQDITERKRLEDTLRGLAADLSEMDRRKDEFLATLAHELRGPLAPLSNGLEILKRAENPAMQRRAREAMERQLGQMIRLVDDLLDLNRINYNRLELRQTRVALAPMIQQAVESCRPFAESFHHELHITLPREPSYLLADPARLAQVFGNLISNACKYTPPGGTISVNAVRQGDEVVVSVQDNGTGIPPDKLESIFDMFMQVDRSLERAHGGLGIGLTLVKRLVHMHGGVVEAKSPGLGHGSEFIVRLPVMRDETTVAPHESAARTPGPKARRILIVDDNLDSAESLAMLLQLGGNETYTAHDGLDALDAVEKHRPDVALLDIGLPKLNGHDVARRVRSEAWGKDIVLIALTGWGQEEDRRKSREAGFDGHLVKPVDHAKLADLLSSLRSRGARPH